MNAFMHGFLDELEKSARDINLGIIRIRTGEDAVKADRERRKKTPKVDTSKLREVYRSKGGGLRVHLGKKKAKKRG